MKMKPNSLLPFALITSSSWSAVAFTSSTTTHPHNAAPWIVKWQEKTTSLHAALRKDIEIPLLDLIDRTINTDSDKDEFVVPLPSSDFPDQLATPFLYGMQMDTPLHKMILEEAILMAETVKVPSSAPLLLLSKPFTGILFGRILIWIHWWVLSVAPRKSAAV